MCTAQHETLGIYYDCLQRYLISITILKSLLIKVNKKCIYKNKRDVCRQPKEFIKILYN